MNKIESVWNFAGFFSSHFDCQLFVKEMASIFPPVNALSDSDAEKAGNAGSLPTFEFCRIVYFKDRAG